MFKGSKQFTVETSGRTTLCVSFGKGEKVLVMLPGLSLRTMEGAASPLAFTYRIFSEDYRVLFIDRSDPAREHGTIREMAEDAAEVLKALEIRDADVVGVSQGGMIAQYLAIDHPELVHKLVLGVTSARVNPVIEEAVKGWISLAEKGNYEGIVEDMMPKLYSEQYMKKYRLLLPMLLKLVKLSDPERFIRHAEAILTFDATEELDRISCPVLVLGGRKDRIIGPEGSEELAKRLGCPYHIYEEYGHSAYEEAKDFNSRILSFLKGKA